ncbi:hypothetical protein PH551_19300 [Rhizobium sp. CNPSo 3490]|nr:hypothetical protein [Rhizobium sp. CNPSo 3490]MDK4734703.1 hypothetical protein [Rhizobium sp. CNPSo 3490]
MDVADLHTDGDGYVSKAEFVSARPSDVSEDQAGTLFDSEGAGSLSVDALAETMSAQPSEHPDDMIEAAQLHRQFESVPGRLRHQG